MFKAGDKVICISPSTYLTENKIYTIQDVVVDHNDQTEYVQILCDKGFARHYYASRFKLVSDSEDPKLPDWF